MKSVPLIQIQFQVNGERHTLDVDPSMRLLDVLREQLRLTGTKEGCGKGECGACTVIMDDRTVDSCLVMAYQANGSEIWTIEGLPCLWEKRCGHARTPSPASSEEESVELHPVQRAFVECGSSQCGICIPGMVVSTADLLTRNPNPSDEEIRYGLAGNLCRCTGYVKIFDAVRRAATEIVETHPKVLRKIRSEKIGRGAKNAHSATTLRDALRILAGDARPRLWQLSGGTDVLVRAKDGIESAGAMFDIFKIKELHGIRETKAKSRHSQNGDKSAGEIWIGAATTFTEVLECSLLKEFAPALVQACSVIGGPQIRNRGTIGGNFANASPAADSVPALMSMGAILEIASLKRKREVPAEKFFLGPGETILKKGELIVGVRIPKLPNVVGCYLRLGQRQAQAISKVDIAVTAVLNPQKNGDGTKSNSPFEYLGICCGSVAPKVFRAEQTEKILREMSWEPETLRLAKESVKREVQPIDDIRSTADYRREMSAVLLERALEKIGLVH
jgi:xanthine dehydrogenase small subunit